MKRSAFFRYSKRKYKKSGFSYQRSPFNNFYRVDNRNRCLSDTVFGRPRANGCDCQGCVEARKLIAKVNRGAEICEMFKINKKLADLVDVLLTDQDIYDIVISGIGSEGKLDNNPAGESTEKISNQ
jgi:hypothetical protein